MDDGNSYPVIHPFIQREIDQARTEARAIGRQAEANCDGRHRRQNEAHLPLHARVGEHHETLIELVGRSGERGQVGVLDARIDSLEKDLESAVEQQQIDHEDLSKIKHGQLRYSAAGAAGGGGALVGLIEFIKYLT